MNVKNKTQILLIHGGETFKNHKDYLNYLKTKNISLDKRVSWTGDYLNKSLGNKFQIIYPRMPLKENAKYQEWKIIFKRYLTFMEDRYILIGNSLGGIFLAKYLSEHKLVKKALAVYLIAPPFDNTLGGEDLAGGFRLKKDLSRLEENCENIYLLFSKDDDVVPIAHADKYKQKLKQAHIIIYKSKNGHFNISRFPEIIKLLLKDIK